MSDDKMKISFAAIDPYIEVNRMLPTEKDIPGKDMVEWGTGNRYPFFLYSLFNGVPTLGSVIEGTVNFVSGDGVTAPRLGTLEEGKANRSADTFSDIVREMARDYLIYGGFALQVIRDMSGNPAEVYWIDMRYLRSNRENTVFYYSEKWDVSYARKKAVKYPAFMDRLEWQSMDDEARKAHASSILFVKDNRRFTYPVPVYISAIKSCEIERDIDDYHLNSINNGFSDGMIVNFNNGVPPDKMKEEIEKSFNEKFSGHQNAGRIMFSWNANKDNRTDIVVPQTRDYGEKYNTLASRSRQQIFTAFRANPNLFGIPTENNGFSNEEYTDSFNLYNRTQVQPIQKKICEALDRVFGVPGAAVITSFTLMQA